MLRHGRRVRERSGQGLKADRGGRSQCGRDGARPSTGKSVEGHGPSWPRSQTTVPKTDATERVPPKWDLPRMDATERVPPRENRWRATVPRGRRQSSVGVSPSFYGFARGRKARDATERAGLDPGFLKVQDDGSDWPYQRLTPGHGSSRLLSQPITNMAGFAWN